MGDVSNLHCVNEASQDGVAGVRGMITCNGKIQLWWSGYIGS